MLLDDLLSTKSHALALPGLDCLPSTELAKLLRQYLVACKVDGKTRKTLIAYGEFVGYFIRFLHKNDLDCPPTEINQNHIRLFVLSLQERKLTPETCSAYYRALHSFFNWLEREEHLETNPFVKLHAPKVPKKHVRALPPEVMANIVALCSADRSFAGNRNYALVLVFLDTGVRQEEMARMKLADIISEQGLIRVFGKGSKERIVAMGEHCQEVLFDYLLRRRDAYDCVWVSEEGVPLSQRGIATAIRRIAERVRIPDGLKRGTHIYRHTAATSYLRNNGNIKCLQELMGHENIKTTMKYADALGPEVAIADHRLASPVDNLLRGHSRPIDNLLGSRRR